jgi:hypothetical protein
MLNDGWCAGNKQTAAMAVCGLSVGCLMNGGFVMAINILHVLVVRQAAE